MGEDGRGWKRMEEREEEMTSIVEQVRSSTAVVVKVIR
jgi:hypothetical protein